MRHLFGLVLQGNSDKITVLTESELKIYAAHVGSLGMLAGKRIVY